MSADRTPNGAIRAKRVPRRESRFRKPSRNIAAIDFGTKNCSLAYITENDRLELTQGVPKLPLNGTYLRVPTAILLNHEGQIEAFGHDARTLYGNLEDHEQECYFYFEEIKMNLLRDQVRTVHLYMGYQLSMVWPCSQATLPPVFDCVQYASNYSYCHTPLGPVSLDSSYYVGNNYYSHAQHILQPSYITML